MRALGEGWVRYEVKNKDNFDRSTLSNTLIRCFLKHLSLPTDVHNCMSVI